MPSVRLAVFPFVRFENALRILLDVVISNRSAGSHTLSDSLAQFCIWRIRGLAIPKPRTFVLDRLGYALTATRLEIPAHIGDIIAAEYVPKVRIAQIPNDFSGCFTEWLRTISPSFVSLKSAIKEPIGCTWLG